METSRGLPCHACLSTDRNIVALNDFMKKQCFLQLILEIPARPSETSVSLCWECRALLRRFTKFKKQAQKSYIALQNYTGKTFPALGALQIEKQYNICLHPNRNDNDVIQSEIIKIENHVITKTENGDLNAIKEEYDGDLSQDANNSDDDDKTLIELCNKEIQISSLKKKRQKKERDPPRLNIKSEDEYYKEKELTQEEIGEERRCLELREDYVNAVFRCEKCILSFPNADDLKDHVSLKHEMNASSWKCPWCACSFGSQMSYNYHASKHTRRYQCVVCAGAFTSKRGAVRHYEMTHVARPDLEYDNICNKRIEKDQILETNGHDSTKADDTPLFPCEFCDKTFRWKTSLRKHVETHRIETGQKRRPYCEPCRLSFTTTSNLQKHVKTSSKHQIQLKLRKLTAESQPPNASSQEKEQASIEQIRSSVNSGRQLFPCTQCDRKFQWRGNLLRHLHSHAAKANGELVCEPCNRTFSSIATYKQHMKISRKHVSEKDFNYMCSDCGKRFANKTRLKDHVDWEHLKNYVHKCPVCQKVFKSHTSLYLHKQVVHKKDNAEHLCDHCGKPFPNRAKLRSHIVALHTSEAPYACSACNARFSWHSCLSRHVRRVHKAKLEKV